MGLTPAGIDGEALAADLNLPACKRGLEFHAFLSLNAGLERVFE